MEIWREIFTDYLVSNFGNVDSLKRGKRKRLRPQGVKGYSLVTFIIGGKKKAFLVHRLVAALFIPNPENKPEVNHINGDKSDNRAQIK